LEFNEWFEKNKNKFQGDFKSGKICASCKERNLTPGNRFKCWECDVDLCTKCVDNHVEVQNHKKSHRMFKMKEKVDYTCDECVKTPLKWGNHYRCATCDNYDLCSSCFEKYHQKEAKKPHSSTHKMLQF